MKKRTVFTIVFAFAAAALIVGGFSLFHRGEKEKDAETPKSAYDLKDEAYSAAAQSFGEKVYPSDIDGLYYSLSPLRYYLVSQNGIEQVAPTKTLKVTPKVAGVTMQFDIPYVSISGDIFGVAQWRGAGDVYTEATAVLKRMPKALAKEEFLLLLNTESAGTSVTESRYSEAFCVNGSGECTCLFDPRNRPVEQSGKLRTDWDVLTLSMLKSGSGIPSLTGRNYSRDENAQVFDLRLTKAGSTDIVARGIRGFISAEQSKLRFLRADNEKWQIVESVGGKETVVAAIKGNLTNEYTLYSRFARRNSDDTVVLFEGGREVPLPCAFKKVYAIEDFGTKLIYIGKEENRDGKDFKVQKLVMYDLVSGRSTAIYANSIFDEESSLSLCASGVVSEMNGKSVFISYNSLEKMAVDVIK